MFTKILIANRGEIAVRIIRACKEMEIKTVAVYSEIDKKSRHVQLADEAYCIGPASSSESYLRYHEIVYTAMRAGAQAIHPGYGFLSENAEFAELCQTSKITFIGPSPDALRKMGDKAVARETIRKVRVPIAQGSSKPLIDAHEAHKIADKTGYPILIKPSAGGGGKGMRIVNRSDEFIPAFQSSQAEARSAFGSEEIYLEKFIRNARHIEFQILADNHGTVVHLGERECSVQRRHQKLIEEAPSTFLDPKVRSRMGRAAIRAAQAVNYSGAGTVEFLVDDRHHFYFIEMNTRIQVEHPITECITGIDLIKAQLWVAAGERLGLKQSTIRRKGHAIECRINAEDPHHDFMPSPGRVNALGMPGGPGIRVDTHIYCGYDIPHHYDSLLAKLIVHADNRDLAIKRMKRALEEFNIDSVKTTIPYLQRIMDDHRFLSGEYTTNLTAQVKEDDDHHRLKGFMHRIMDSFHRWVED
ncbi:MAG: acetyl-CoA carboxylase biotin carboxylase subunit [Chitinivibrionales bacterium]|nr:acetyl-CoA carboxylase biotin carboxylase subunit [Chitinivibrionales bacterium]